MKNENKIGFETANFAGATSNKSISISNVLVVQPPKRDSPDIETWKTAMKSADRGKRQKLYDLYDNLLIDTVLSDSVEKRIRHITNGGLRFLSDNKEVDEMTDFLKSPEFRKLLREILLTRFYGKSIIELQFGEKFKIYSIPRKHIDVTKKVVLKSLGDDSGIPYKDDDFLLEVGEDKDLGIFLKTAPHVIFKRNGGADYAQYCELFGIPILAGMYDPEDDGSREEMEKTMSNRGAGGSIVMSNKGKVETIGESGGNVNSIHNAFLKYLDEQILIGILGQTMTSKDGSSKAQSQTHAETEDDINQDDQVYATEFLNTELIPRLEKRGFPVKGGWFVFPQKDNLSQKEKLEIAKEVHDITEKGVDDDYFYETFGLPKGNKQVEVTPADPNNPLDKNNPKDQKQDPQKKAKQKIKAKELSFLQKLKDFFDQAPL